MLLLAISGITLNHATDLDLDRRYVSWSWLLDAYGIHSPQRSASFADGGSRGTLMGDRLFLDGQDTGQRSSGIAGVVVIEPLVIIAGQHSVHIFLKGGQAVESIDLSAVLPGPIERIGRVGDRAVIQSNNNMFRSDTEITVFEAWGDDQPAEVLWSVESSPGAGEIAALDTAWRGRGVTVERVLLDLHSGKLFGLPGTLFMDLVALCMIILGISGLILSSRNRRGSHSEV